MVGCEFLFSQFGRSIPEQTKLWEKKTNQIDTIVNNIQTEIDEVKLAMVVVSHLYGKHSSRVEGENASAFNNGPIISLCTYFFIGDRFLCGSLGLEYFYNEFGLEQKYTLANA